MIETILKVSGPQTEYKNTLLVNDFETNSSTVTSMHLVGEAAAADIVALPPLSCCLEREESQRRLRPRQWRIQQWRRQVSG